MRHGSIMIIIHHHTLQYQRCLKLDLIIFITHKVTPNSCCKIMFCIICSYKQSIWISVLFLFGATQNALHIFCLFCRVNLFRDIYLSWINSRLNVFKCIFDWKSKAKLLGTDIHVGIFKDHSWTVCIPQIYCLPPVCWMSPMGQCLIVKHHWLNTGVILLFFSLN